MGYTTETEMAWRWEAALTSGEQAVELLQVADKVGVPIELAAAMVDREVPKPRLIRGGDSHLVNGYRDTLSLRAERFDTGVRLLTELREALRESGLNLESAAAVTQRVHGVTGGVPASMGSAAG